MIVCSRKGCGLTFDPLSSSSDDCVFHSGAPIFHEGRKGWSCCEKRVYDFDEFMKIPGCSRGPHQEKPLEESLPPSINEEESSKLAESFEAVVHTKEEEGEPTVVVDPSSLLSFPEKSAAVSAVEEKISDCIKEADLNDPENAVIPANSTCKRLGCNFRAGDANDGPCRYHPGAPIFHEGSKGYTCCPRKVLEFDEFLKIAGCVELSKHRFLDPIGNPSKEPHENAGNSNVKAVADFRWDWYQTIDSIIISIYVKNVQKENLSVVFYGNAFELKTTTTNVGTEGIVNWKPIELFSTIDPKGSIFNVFKTKVELILKKTSGLSWPTLEKSDNIVSWTTFGTQDGKTTGTVGGKEYHIAKDIPLEALKRRN